MQRSKNRRLVLVLLLALTAVTTAAALVTIVGPLVRYSFTENMAYGHTVRSDRITGGQVPFWTVAGSSPRSSRFAAAMSAASSDKAAPTDAP
jgi:hypothetical protein